jgi:hypothetical protein
MTEIGMSTENTTAGGVDPAFEKLLDFLVHLEQHGISFQLKYIRADTVMVLIYNGGYWEVEFFADGHVEVEVYTSRAGVEGEEVLDELFADYSDDDRQDS